MAGGTFAKPYPGRSARRRPGVTSNRFTNWVRPGVRLVRARSLRRTMALSALDLPLLERPANAISAPESSPKAAAESALLMKRTWGYLDIAGGRRDRWLAYNSGRAAQSNSRGPNEVRMDRIRP